MANATLSPRWFSQRVQPMAPVLIVCLLLALLMAFGATLNPRFLTQLNLLNMAEQATDLLLVSLGQTVVILTGGIDLSVGSIISLVTCLTSGLVNGDPAMVMPVVAGMMLLGAAIGFANGALIVTLRVHPLIVTLGTGAAIQGVTLLYSPAPFGKVTSDYSMIAYTRVIGMPIGTLVCVALYALAFFGLRYSALGRYIFAVGGDEKAATLLGLPRNRVTLIAFAFSGFCASLTGLYLAARFGVGQPYAGATYSLASITPVILGGTLLAGGRGGVIGTFIGVLLLGVMNNILNFMALPKQIQLVAQALVIIAAVSIYVERRREL